MRLPPPVPPGPGAPERSNLDELRRALGAIGLDEVDRRLVAFGNGPDGLARMRSYVEQQSDLLRAFKEKPPFEKPSLLFFPMADVLGRIWDQFDLNDVGIASADPMFRVFSDFLEQMHQRTQRYLDLHPSDGSSKESPLSGGVSIGGVSDSVSGRAGHLLHGSDASPATGMDFGEQLAAMDGQALLGFFEAHYSIDREVANMLIARIWELRRADRISERERLNFMNLVLERLLRGGSDASPATGTDLGEQLAAMDKSDLFGFFEAHYSIDREVGNMLIARIWELRRAGRISEHERLDLRNLVLERLLRGGSDASPATGTDFGRQLASMDGQALLGFFEAQYSIDRRVGNMLIERIWELRRAGRISEGERLDFMNLVLERLLRG